MADDRVSPKQRLEYELFWVGDVQMGHVSRELESLDPLLRYMHQNTGLGILVSNVWDNLHLNCVNV